MIATTAQQLAAASRLAWAFVSQALENATKTAARNLTEPCRATAEVAVASAERWDCSVASPVAPQATTVPQFYVSQPALLHVVARRSGKCLATLGVLHSMPCGAPASQADGRMAGNDVVVQSPSRFLPELVRRTSALLSRVAFVDDRVRSARYLPACLVHVALPAIAPVGLPNGLRNACVCALAVSVRSSELGARKAESRQAEHNQMGPAPRVSVGDCDLASALGSPRVCA